MTPFRLTALFRPGTVAALPARQPNPPSHVRHHHALGTLHHRCGARTGRAQRDAAAIDGTARHLGRHQYPLPVRLSVLDRLLCGRAGRDGGSYSVAGRGVLAVAVARRTQPDRRYRADAARDERPVLRGDDGVPEDRSDPDRDFRLCLSRRSPHDAEGHRHPDRDRRRGHHRAAACGAKEFCRIEADRHRPGRRGGVRAVGGRFSWRDHHRAGRDLRDGGVVHAGAGAVRADPGADDLPAGARARRAQGKSSGCGSPRCLRASWAHSPRSSGSWHSR